MTGANVDGEDTVQLDYIKSNHFRVIYVDGVIGSVAPSGMVQMALFSEREAIPRSVSHLVDDDGRLGAVQTISGRPGYVREVDVCAMLTLDTAKFLASWLDERIGELESEVSGGAEV